MVPATPAVAELLGQRKAHTVLFGVIRAKTTVKAYPVFGGMVVLTVLLVRYSQVV
jgi:hypothetical protein